MSAKRTRFPALSLSTRGVSARAADQVRAHYGRPRHRPCPFADVTKCYLNARNLDGAETTGLVAVCGADEQGNVYILISTDAQLAAPGWTFGTRAAPDVVGQSNTLSPQAQQVCTAARHVLDGSLVLATICSGS